MLRMCLQLQTGENTHDFSSPKAWERSNNKAPSRNCALSNTVRRAHTPGEQKNPAPPTKLSSKTPCLSTQRGMCAHGVEKDSSERRDRPLVWCESPTKYPILSRKAPVFCLAGSQDQKRFQKKTAWTPNIPDLINRRPVLSNKGNTVSAAQVDAANPAWSARCPAKGRLHGLATIHRLRPTIVILICRMNKLFTPIFSKQTLGADSVFWAMIAKYRKRRKMSERTFRKGIRIQTPDNRKFSSGPKAICDLRRKRAQEQCFCHWLPML